MIDWIKIANQSPEMYHKYMDSGIDELEDFFAALNIFVELSIHEMESGEEMYSLKAKTKHRAYEINSMKSVLVKGKIVQIRTNQEFMERHIFTIFNLLEKQIKDKNYLQN